MATPQRFNFDVHVAEMPIKVPGEPCLPPFRGRTSQSRHASYTGAVHAQRTRGEKQQTYAQILRNHGPMTDQDVAALTRWPLSSVNSTRDSFGDQVVPMGFEPSPFGRAKRTRWGFK
jgi:hypothetical protein